MSKSVQKVLALALLQALIPLKASALGILIPAYFSPGTRWTELNDAAKRVPLIAIMNPNNGPGTSSSSAYVNAINSLRQLGGRVIGYVYSSYTARPLADVQADIDRYSSFYNIDGIFVDEVTNDSTAAHVDYYDALYQYIKGKNPAWIVVGNPGINASAAYVTRPTVDTLVTFESNSGYETNVPDVWTRTQPPTAISHLCYAVTDSATMTNYINIAVTRNAGHIYVTDDSGSNPWDRLPTYWSVEISLIESINREAARQKPPILKVSGTNANSAIIAVDGVAGRYVLQSSNNFTNWQPTATNVSATGKFNFRVPQTNSPVQSFRTQQ